MNTILNLRRYSPIALGLAALVFAFSSASAQSNPPVSALPVTLFSGNYVSIAGDGSSMIFAQGQDDYSYFGNTTGFDIKYDGSTYPVGSVFSFSSNGFLALGARVDPVPDFNRYAVAAAVSNVIMPFNLDLVLYPQFGAGEGAGYYEVSGTAPNRVMTWEWSSFIIFYNTGYETAMQVKIYETSNLIEFWYRDPGYQFDGTVLPNNNNFDDPSAGIVGLNGDSPSNDNNYYDPSASFIPPQNIRFGRVAPNIQLSTSPKSFNFGAFQAGSGLDMQVTVTNAGTDGPLIISSATLAGDPDFTIVGPLPGPLPAFVSGTITVRFTAQGNAARNATLNIVSNGRDSGTQSITFTGFSINPDISVDSVIRFKKTRTRLGDSLTQWVHITSVVPSTFLFISSFQITGIDADQYFISTYPSNPIPGGQTDSVAITYVPTKEGKHVATLVINSNAFSNPSLSISLQGTGILPHIVVTPPLLLFDSTREGDTICKTISIWNPGSDSLRILSNFFISNDGDFHYTGLSGSQAVIPPDQTRLVTVCFIPIQQGERQARLLLKTNIINTFDTPRQDTGGTVTIDIRGTGVPFGIFANAVSGLPFTDSALIGATVCRTDTLKNNGDADILVSSLAIAGVGGTNGADFSYSGLPAFPFVLHSRSWVSFNICGTPDKQGLLTGVATISGTTNGSKTGLMLPLVIFGFKACISAAPIALFDSVVLPNNGSDSTLCMTITNCGDVPAVYNASISGASKADYSVTPAVSGTVAPHGGTTQFCVKYKPSAIGALPASLDVTTTDRSESTSVPLKGADGCATLTHDIVSVPNTGNNEKKQFTFTITNGGTFPWTPGTPVISGPGASAYNGSPVTVVPLPSPPGKDGDPIPPGGQATVTMTFHPLPGSAGQDFVANVSWPKGGPCEDAVVSVDITGHSIISSVREITSSEGFVLDQSYPNPTQGNTWFTYTTPRETEVRITLVSLTGETIRTLIAGRVSEGLHTVNFDARDLPSGTYVYLLESGSTRLVRQLILAK